MNPTAIKCPKCGSLVKSNVTDSRSPMTGDYIRRRRECGACGFRYSTREVVWTGEEENTPTFNPVEVFKLRALAVDILNRTNPIIRTSPLTGQR